MIILLVKRNINIITYRYNEWQSALQMFIRTSGNHTISESKSFQITQKHVLTWKLFFKQFMNVKLMGFIDIFNMYNKFWTYHLHNFHSKKQCYVCLKLSGPNYKDYFCLVCFIYNIVYFTKINYFLNFRFSNIQYGHSIIMSNT